MHKVTIKAGFIGMGAMGEPMARNLHTAGLLVGVYNRTAKRARDFAAETGVKACDDPAALAAECDVVVTCVSADADVLAVVDAMLGSIRPGSVVVDCSTVKSDTASEAADRLAKVEAAFLDCPVSGGTEGAEKGTLAMMCGGDEKALEKAMPVLECMAGRIVHMGPVGAGQATKAVNQIMVAGINQAVTEGLAFAEAMDLPLDKVIDVVGGGAAGSWFLAHRGPNMVRGRFPLGFKVSLHEKDLEICREMADKLGVALPVIEMTLLHYQRVIDAGYGDNDISALYALKQELFRQGAKDKSGA
jgi:3-hydroxyisobutyrate dehydrogenase